MKKAIIYARYSSDSQTEQSIEGQLRVCREYAQNNDILIVDTIYRPRYDGNKRQPCRISKNAERQQPQRVAVPYRLQT